MNKTARLLRLIDLMRPPGATKEFVARSLGVSVRSVERYLAHDLSQLGFDFDSDAAGRHFVFRTDGRPRQIRLTDAEADFISDLMRQVQPDHPLSQHIQTKLFFANGNGKWESSVIRQNLPKIVGDLTTAMKINCQVRIPNYYSAYQGKRVDRIVEPLRFTSNYRYLVAYEALDDRFVNIKIDRIDKIIPLELTCTRSPDEVRLDLFQMAFNGAGHQVCIWLTPLAYRLLIEERPAALDHVASISNQEPYTHELHTQVATLLPIGRFCLGLPGQIRVVKGQALKSHLRKR